MGEPVMGVSDLYRDRNCLLQCHPPPCSHLHTSGTGDLGLWGMVTFLAFSSYLRCLHPNIFCRMETMGLVSVGTWRG